jgi:hypothetical protein
MKHKKILILSLLLALVITGKSQIEITVQQPIQENFVESELISEISFIPLSYEKMGAIAPDMELKADGEDYFILDNKFTQSVFRFNDQGELLDTITTQKRDTGQKNLPLLNNPSKFSINPTLKQVEIFISKTFHCPASLTRVKKSIKLFCHFTLLTSFATRKEILALYRMEQQRISIQAHSCR